MRAAVWIASTRPASSSELVDTSATRLPFATRTVAWGLFELHVLAQVPDVEPREAAAGEPPRRLGLGLSRSVEGGGEQIQELRRGHECPTSVLRKRAGGAPCATCMAWIGSPLPQLARPQMRVSSGPQMASQLRHSSGVTPV